jgi:hypothetical protein
VRYEERERVPATRLVGGLLVPLEWDLPLEPEAQLEETRRLAAECGSACTRRAAFVPLAQRPAVIVIAGISTLAAERLEARSPDIATLLGLCIQVVSSSEPRLEELGESTSGLILASAARRFSQSCERALMALAPELY